MPRENKTLKTVNEGAQVGSTAFFGDIIISGEGIKLRHIRGMKQGNTVFPCLTNKGTRCSLVSKKQGNKLFPCFNAQNLVFRSLV
jgi:hypothetical protein